VDSIYWACLLSFMAGACGYIITRFWIMPIRHYRRVKRQLLKGLSEYAQKLPSDPTGKTKKAFSAGRLRDLRRLGVQLVSVHDGELPYWYRLVLVSRKESPQAASEPILRLENMPTSGQARQCIDVIKSRLRATDPRSTQSIAILLCWLILFPAMAEATVTAEAARPPESLTLCNEPVPMGQGDVRERFEREMLLTLGNRTQVLLWLKRSKRFLPYISEELRKAGLPDDLKYLPVIESALMPHIGSSAGALGFWQLMPATARKYGLTVDEHIDQRRDVYLSTPAALDYLKSLHARFSSWALALAAYNMGEEGLDAEILEQKNTDYYRLYLSLETQRFVFKLLAAKLVIAQPESYGFQMAPDDYFEPLRFETVRTECHQETPIRLIATAASTDFKTIKDLNPHLRGYYLQAGSYALRLPPGSTAGFERRFRKMADDYEAQRQQRIYVVQNGDSLSTIAAKFDVPVAALLIWNGINVNKTLYAGERLVVFPRTLNPEQ